MRTVIILIIIILIIAELGTVGFYMSTHRPFARSSQTPITPVGVVSKRSTTPIVPYSSPSLSTVSVTPAPSGTLVPTLSITPVPTTSITPVATPPESDEYTKGLEHYEKMDYYKAKVCFKQAVKKTPKNAWVHYYLFLCYTHIEEDPFSKKSLAYKEAQATLNLNPEKTMKENIRSYLDDVERRGSIAIHPTPEKMETPKIPATSSPSSSYNLPPPLDFTPDIPIITAKDADLHYQKGKEYDSKGNFNWAVTEYSNAIKINPKHVDAYISRGSLYESKQNYNDAIKDYSKALEIKPSDAKILYRRGKAFQSINDIEKAKVDLMKAKELEPSLADKVDPILKELEKGQNESQ